MSVDGETFRQFGDLKLVNEPVIVLIFVSIVLKKLSEIGVFIFELIELFIRDWLIVTLFIQLSENESLALFLLVDLLMRLFRTLGDLLPVIMGLLAGFNRDWRTVLREQF